MTATPDLLLTHRLAEALPSDLPFNIYHLSSPPTSCPAIYSAPSGQEPEKTFCESHFLSVTIPLDSHQIQVFALEVLIYTTEYLTTLFVSKADSTGYLHLVKIPREIPSPSKTISSIFLAYLVEKRRRAGRRLVLSLFARAQDQYLFPGSIENKQKHVLDDRALVKWWCRVLDPVLRDFRLEKSKKPYLINHGNNTFTSQGYLKVPGCDLHETRAFFPDSMRKEPTQESHWTAIDPLRNLARSPYLPERCLIPRFPDDPKARFVDELDDELPESESRVQESPSKGRHSGRWKSVRSLEQFWEMMAFRQECSSGRLVGFIWGVFVPLDLQSLDFQKDTVESSINSSNEQQIKKVLPTPLHPQVPNNNHASRPSPTRDMILTPCPSSPLEAGEGYTTHPRTSSTKPNQKSKRKLTGPIMTRQPRIKGSARPLGQQAEKTKYYFWPTSSQGEVVLRQKDYTRANDLLLQLDYANADIAKESTKRWIEEVSIMAGIKSWGQSVVGRKKVSIHTRNHVQSDPTTLNASLVRKKKRPSEEDDGRQTNQSTVGTTVDRVTVLDTGLVRKKTKLSPSLPAELMQASHSSGVNVLSPGLLRKKAKG
ncbi:hypothetical protein MMC12_001268 [Toensbergia leucococca]|nr:hypothetical protein [Toensbergia leucococca]